MRIKCVGYQHFVIWVTYIWFQWWYGGARARIKCVWAEFKELSSILTARCASYRNEREREREREREIYRA